MKLGDKVWELIDLSVREMARLHTKWRTAERIFMSYTPQREIDRQRELRKEQGEPDYTTIVLPYSYAMLMAAHTYWSTVFLSRDPVFQFTSAHGEGQSKVLALEALVDYQVRTGGMIPVLYAWLLDIGKFGVGVLRVWWEEERRIVAGASAEGDAVLETVVPGYQGTKIANVRPHDFLPDPRVPLMQFQEGEFCASRFFLSEPALMARARRGEFESSAAERLRKARAQKSRYERMEEPPNIAPVEGAIELFEAFVWLDPKEWGLPGVDGPALWRFVVSDGGDEVLLAEPFPTLWRGFPFIVQPLEPDPYTLNARSIIDILDPVQDTIDWLVNSHMFNVRQMTNGTIVVDPTRVSIDDLRKPPVAGRIVRGKPAATGTDLRTAIFPLAFPDVTQRHFSDIEMLHQFGQRSLGINDQIMGMLGAGSDRKTATEVRTSTTFGTNRLRVIAEFISSLGMRQLAELIVAQSQQYASLPLKLRVVGSLAATAGQDFVEVAPEDIAGRFDFIPVDGTLPIDRYAQVALWKDLLSQIAQVPQIVQQYDLGKIFGWLAQLAGIRNLGQFRAEVPSVDMGGTGAPAQAPAPSGLEEVMRALGAATAGTGGGPVGG